MLNRLNLFLSVALALVLLALLLIRVDYSRPNYQVNMGDDMTYSPAYSPYEANDNFPSGRTMQSPVPGTIARGITPLHYEATLEDAIRAGEELLNPFDRSTESGAVSTERGQAVFQSFCIACHGGDGSGNGPVTKRGFPPPPTLLSGKTLQMKDGQLLHILTLGQNSMPNFAAQLPPDRRWDVINYIRSLQVAVSPEAGVQSPEPKLESSEARVESQETTETPAPEIESTPEPGPPAEPDSSAEPTESAEADTETKP